MKRAFEIAECAEVRNSRVPWN